MGGTIFDGGDSTSTAGSGGYLCGGSGGSSGIMAMMALAQAAEAVEDQTHAGNILDPAPGGDGGGGAYGGGGGGGGRARRPMAFLGAAVGGMAVLAVAVAPQERSGLSSLAVMEEMVGLAAAQASESAPRSIRTANLDSRAASEEVATAVVVAAGVERWEAPSSIKAVQLCPQQHVHPQRCGQGGGRSRFVSPDRASNGGDSGAAIFS